MVLIDQDQASSKNKEGGNYADNITTIDLDSDEWWSRDDGLQELERDEVQM